MRLLVLDVDGTLTTTASGETFRKTADDWQWLPGRIEKCRELRKQGVQITIASNQAGVAFPWSKFTEAQIQAELEAVAQEIDACYVGVCYSTPNAKALPQYCNANDSRRKPGPGMILEAMALCGVGAEETVMVGDRPEDEEAAKSAGVQFIHADKFFAQVQAPRPKTFRWICLECGNKYNGRRCPRCEGEDRILNSEQDYDPSYIGGSRSEPYVPGE